jgi:hypothetical protein
VIQREITGRALDKCSGGLSFVCLSFLCQPKFKSLDLALSLKLSHNFPIYTLKTITLPLLVHILLKGSKENACEIALQKKN